MGAVGEQPTESDAGRDGRQREDCEPPVEGVSLVEEIRDPLAELALDLAPFRGVRRGAEDGGITYRKVRRKGLKCPAYINGLLTLEDERLPASGARTSLGQTRTHPCFVPCPQILDHIDSVCRSLAIKPGVAILAEQDQVVVLVSLSGSLRQVGSRSRVGRGFDVSDVADYDDGIVIGGVHEQLDATAGHGTAASSPAPEDL